MYNTKENSTITFLALLAYQRNGGKKSLKIHPVIHVHCVVIIFVLSLLQGRAPEKIYIITFNQ